MKNKILIIVYVPLLEKEYSIYIPTIKKVGVIKRLIIEIIEEESEGIFKNDGTKHLYDKFTGEKIADNQFVRNSTIKNGTKLILY